MRKADRLKLENLADNPNDERLARVGGRAAVILKDFDLMASPEPREILERIKELCNEYGLSVVRDEGRREIVFFKSNP